MAGYAFAWAVLVGGVLGFALACLRGRRQVAQAVADCEARWRARFPGPMLVHLRRRPARLGLLIPRRARTCDDVFVVRDGGDAYLLTRRLPDEAYDIEHLDI